MKTKVEVSRPSWFSNFITVSDSSTYMYLCGQGTGNREQGTQEERQN
ncbi:hypothetical protein PN492_08615 [Dolichospermum circinale CS-537/01]|uniref:Uncharacterized protein n=1 Tax=Dolichospermum circinale CS-537/01 TaxID=3021739 RepID=A0ABT5A4G8_9CYAN|nr:hypothetical protein [Dolichospermum circinale]MDB9486608.1 hypothetical protein [Dolichospermum circinale CS-537/01]